jgi:hypothetical protein
MSGGIPKIDSTDKIRIHFDVQELGQSVQFSSGSMRLNDRVVNLEQLNTNRAFLGALELLCLRVLEIKNEAFPFNGAVKSIDLSLQGEKITKIKMMTEDAQYKINGDEELGIVSAVLSDELGNLAIQNQLSPESLENKETGESASPNGNGKHKFSNHSSSLAYNKLSALLQADAQMVSIQRKTVKGLFEIMQKSHEMDRKIAKEQMLRDFIKKEEIKEDRIADLFVALLIFAQAKPCT